MNVNPATGEVDDLITHDFSAFLATAEDGILDQDCSEALRDLAQAVMRIGKTGKMVLTVTLDKVDEGIAAVKIKTDLKVSPPKLPRSSSIRFVDPDNGGSLSENPPGQTVFFNRDMTNSDDVEDTGKDD
ncbi:hypothetical protein [Actinobaculum sp. 352]|uniref:hypothetical protein n=1 Tax=Actinobaculum sp. 352 TaxID=2490946 RepID=UPI000F7EC63D|nr:hypothetical protein [Actinobaculum sp. 352]RTE47913.1 hypothetical protein EKN07_11680 [Actinobaculum sp. 352]